MTPLTKSIILRLLAREVQRVPYGAPGRIEYAWLGTADFDRIDALAQAYAENVTAAIKEIEAPS